MTAPKGHPVHSFFRGGKGGASNIAAISLAPTSARHASACCACEQLFCITETVVLSALL